MVATKKRTKCCHPAFTVLNQLCVKRCHLETWLRDTQESGFCRLASQTSNSIDITVKLCPGGLPVPFSCLREMTAWLSQRFRCCLHRVFWAFELTVSTRVPKISFFPQFQHKRYRFHWHLSFNKTTQKPFLNESRSAFVQFRRSLDSAGRSTCSLFNSNFP